MGLSVHVNKFFPAINLVFVLIITLFVTLSVRIWTNPTYPFRVDGASVVKSPKILKSLIVSRPDYNAETVSQVVQGNVFRKERKEYVPPKPTTTAPTPKTAVPLPNLVLKGILILGGTKIAILEGKYWVIQGKGGQPVEKKIKKKGYSLGQIVGSFELTKIDKTSVTLEDNNGQLVRVRLTKRPVEKIIHREGTAFYQKKKKHGPKEFNPAPTQVFRVSGARTLAPKTAHPAPKKAHISGK